ncbi:MAG: hypothetical protein Q8P15_02540 [Nanoarchaeota archaeon]|nr:hypothetical protein [Nanoarchaeota archaeon]
MQKNKKGAEKIISVYWFAILFIVAGAMVYMVSSFYGKPYDVREIEAGLLTDKIAGCVSEAGYIQSVVLSQGFDNSFFDFCNLNFETEDAYGWKEQGQYYTEISIYNFNSEQVLSVIKEGNENLKEFCELGGGNLPVCLKRSLYTIAKDNSQYKIDILSVIRKTEKNA